MATRRQCDVLGGTREAFPYRVTVERLEHRGPQLMLNGDAEAKPREVLIERELDLCDPAWERLGRFIDKGLSKPKGAKRKKAKG